MLNAALAIINGLIGAGVKIINGIIGFLI